jgi:hypothetical protein
MILSFVQRPQDLDDLARELITDAAMSKRAECVRLNKGPHVAEAIRLLDDILRRMDAHQRKKTAFLRALRVSNPGADEMPPASVAL